MADTRNPDAARVARAAMAAIAARGKGGAPPPNDRDPRRVTAHLGTYKIEAEYPSGRADAALTIDRDGALVLKATVEPVWEGERRKDDRIEILEARGDDWFADFLSQAPTLPERAKDEGAIEKPAAAAQRKARPSPKKAKSRALRPAARSKRAAKQKRGAKAAGGKAVGAKGASAKGRAAKAGSRTRPNRSKTAKRPGRR
jgi:hypothetical protein